MDILLLEPEVDSDGRDVTLLELVIRESPEDGGFPDRRRPHNHKLQDIVVALLHLESFDY
jgi:hypothetical protein